MTLTSRYCCSSWTPSQQDQSTLVISLIWLGSLPQVTGSPRIASHRTPGPIVPTSEEYSESLIKPTVAPGLNFVEYSEDVCWLQTASGLDFVEFLIARNILGLSVKFHRCGVYLLKVWGKGMAVLRFSIVEREKTKKNLELNART